MLPLAVKKNKFGQRVADISVTEYYRQIEEEVLEAHENAVMYETARRIVLDGCGACLGEYGRSDEAEELVDIITTCITRLEIIGYDAEKREKLYKAVNEKNKKHGYFED